MADNIIQEVNSPNILIITDSDQNQITVTQPLVNTIEVATPGPQGSVGPIGPAGPTGASTPFTNTTGSIFSTTSSLLITGSLNITQGITGSLLGTASFALSTGGQNYYNAGTSSTVTNIDWTQGTIQELDLVNDPTITVSNGVAGQQTTLLLAQQLAGTRTITWGNNIIWSGNTAPTLPNVATWSPDNTTTFNTGTAFDNNVFAVAVQSDGKILVGGDFTTYNGGTANRLIRLNTNGTVDSSFAIGTAANSTVYAITIQSDGKILVGGSFNSFNGVTANRIIRLNIDGTRDNTFAPTGTGLNSTANTIVIQSDGKYLVGGAFTSYNGTSRNRILRLNSDGTLDTGYNVGTGTNGTVEKIILQSDGKAIAVGNFSSYNSVTIGRIVRINTDGSRDITYNTTTGANSMIYNAEIQTDGKVIITGDFTTYNGITYNRLARVNTDGSLDTTFTVGTGLNIRARSILIQLDGKFLLGGEQTSYNGVSVTRVSRFNLSGSLDTNFTLNTNDFNSQVNTLATQSDGKIVVGGQFTAGGFTGQRNRINRIAVNTIPTYNRIEFTFNGTYYIAAF